jgi:hypothetical protein
VPNYVPPADKANGQTLDAALDWNPAWDALASYLNNGGIGNSQISSNPSEKIPESKLSLTAPSGAHGSRHAAGGADPLPDGSISPAMLQSGVVTDNLLTMRRDGDPITATNLGITYDKHRSFRKYTHGTATSHPQGRGVVRSGKVYFSLYNADKVTELVPSTGVFTDIALTAGDKPRQLLLVGTDIYVLCAGGGSGGQQIKKIDSNNAVTTICNLRTQGAAAVSDLIDLQHMAYSPSAGVIYTIGKRTGDTVYRVLLRVSLTPNTGVTNKNDLGTTNTPRVWGCAFGENDVNARIVCLYRDTAVDGDIRSYDAADLTAVGNLDISSVYTLGTDGDVVYDGRLFYTMASTATANPITCAGCDCLTYTNPKIVVSAITGGAEIKAPGFFDGRTVYGVSFVATAPEFYAIPTAPVVQVEAGVPGKVTIDAGTTAVVTGFATDGKNLWVAIANGATSNAAFIRMPL